MLKFLRSILGGARSVASIVKSLEGIRGDLSAHASAKASERDAHAADAAASNAKAVEAHSEAAKADAVAANIAKLLAA